MTPDAQQPQHELPVGAFCKNKEPHEEHEWDTAAQGTLERRLCPGRGQQPQHDAAEANAEAWNPLEPLFVAWAENHVDAHHALDAEATVGDIATFAREAFYAGVAQAEAALEAESASGGETRRALAARLEPQQASLLEGPGPFRLEYEYRLQGKRIGAGIIEGDAERIHEAYGWLILIAREARAADTAAAAPPERGAAYQSRTFYWLHRLADELSETKPSRKRLNELSNWIRDLAFRVADDPDEPPQEPHHDRP